MHELAHDIGNAIAGLLAELGVVEFTRDDLPSDRAGRYVVKIEATDDNGMTVVVDMRLGVKPHD